MRRSAKLSPRTDSQTSPRDRKERHLHGAEHHLHNSLEQIHQKQSEIQAGVRNRRKQATKLLAAADSAISEFEDGSQSWLKLGKQLDTALRQLGDIDNLFDTLQTRTSSLSKRIVALSTPADGTVVADHPGTADLLSAQPPRDSPQEETHCDSAQQKTQPDNHVLPESSKDHDEAGS